MTLYKKGKKEMKYFTSISEFTNSFKIIAEFMSKDMTEEEIAEESVKLITQIGEFIDFLSSLDKENRDSVNAAIDIATSPDYDPSHESYDLFLETSVSDFLNHIPKENRSLAESMIDTIIEYDLCSNPFSEISEDTAKKMRDRNRGTETKHPIEEILNNIVL